MSDLPTPPPLDKRATRYPVKIIIRVQELAEAGWYPSQIRKFLLTEFGISPHENSIYRWSDPALAEEWRTGNARSQRNARARKKRGRPAKNLNMLADVEKQMVKLRRLGLSYEAIRTVLAEYHDVHLQEHQVRLRCNALGIPKNPLKATAKPRLKVAA